MSLRVRLVWMPLYTLWMSLSHTLCCGFHYETYIGISPYHTLAVVCTGMYGSYVMCDLIVWENTNVVNFSCDKRKKAHVPRIKCSPEGSHLIHGTSAVFSHITLKWTLFAYLILSLFLQHLPANTIHWAKVVGPAMQTVGQHWAIFGSINRVCWAVLPSSQETLVQCWVNVGPRSATLTQQ